MQIGIYSPPNLSLFGWKNESKLIIRSDINGNKYGAIREGKYSAKDLLYSNIANKSNQNKLNSNSNSLNGYLSTLISYKFIAFLSSFAILIFLSTSPVYFLVNLFLLLDVNIYFRSIIWPDKYFSSDPFWLYLAALQFSILLFIFFKERSSHMAFILFYSVTAFIILFHSKDVLYIDAMPFVVTHKKKIESGPIQETS